MSENSKIAFFSLENVEFYSIICVFVSNISAFHKFTKGYLVRN